MDLGKHLGYALSAGLPNKIQDVQLNLNDREAINNWLVCVCSKFCMGHTYIKILFFIRNLLGIFFFAKSGKHNSLYVRRRQRKERILKYF